MICSGKRIAIFGTMIIIGLSLLHADSDDKRSDVLKYGLENEIVELINDLERREDHTFNDELEVLFVRTRSSAVRDSILSFYGAQKNNAFKEYCLEVLEDPYEYPSTTVSSVFAYVQKVTLNDAAPLVRNLLSNESEEFRDQAIRTLGKIGTDEDAIYLFEYLQSNIPGDERQRLIIRQNIMTALGELKSESAWEDFILVAQDEEENTMIRATAARAIGMIGKEGGVEILSGLFEADDPILRAAVVAALAGYTDEEAIQVVLEGLKDTHYRVRLEALEAVHKQNSKKAAPYVRYRADNDPVEAVQMKAYEVLAMLDEHETTGWMISKVREQKTSDKVRMKIISALMEHNRSAVIDDAVQVAFASLKDDKKKWIRYELGKLFAKYDDGALSAVAEAYITHGDTVTKGLGIELYNRNRFSNLKSHVESIAENDRMGGLQSQAKRALSSE